MSQVECLALDAPSLDAEKRAIRDAFSRAADSYDDCAAFQRRVGDYLLSLQPDWRGKTVLDVGCGTGYFSEKLKLAGANVIALDLSDKMLEVARRRCGNSLKYIAGDAEALPLADNSVDVVFSSLALQWCRDLSAPLQELKRVTRPGGRVLFTTLLDGSLIELKKAWQQVDGHAHVNAFLSSKQVKIALAQAGCGRHLIECKPVLELYPSAFALMKDLKGIGATHLSVGRNAGLVGRRAFRQLENAYGAFKLENGAVPATYQVCFGVIENE